MKLWKATVEVEVLIASEEIPDDFDVERAAKREMADNGGDVLWPAEEIQRLFDVPEEWLDTIPRGTTKCKPDKTCRQIMEAYLDAKEAEAMRRPMPNQKALELGDGG